VFGDKFTFKLFTNDAGSGKVKFEVYHHDYQLDKDAVSVIDNRDGSIECTYTPLDIGEHMLDVIWGIDHVKGCPFNLMVQKPAGNHYIAVGSGLNRVTVGKPAKFYITALNGFLNRKDLFISIRTPNHECVVNIDETSVGRCDITYTAQEVGRYKAEIKYCGKDIIFSPFRITAADASKCKIIGITSEDVYVEDLFEFYVDTSEGGDGILKISVTDPNDEQLDLFFKEQNNGQHCIAFIPENEGTHTVRVLWSEDHVPESPLNINIHQSVAAENVYAYGQGLYSGTLGKLAVFTVVTKTVGKGDLTIYAFSTQGKFTVDTTEKGNGIYEASYTPLDIGDISINITWFNIPIPGSPFTAHITSNLTHSAPPSPVAPEEINQNDFEIKGLPLWNNITYINTEVCYIVNTTNRDISTLESTITFSNHESHTILPIEQKLGEYKFRFIPIKAGKYEIAVCCSNTHLHESPYKCIAIDKDASGVIYISNNVAQVGVPYEFYIQGSQSYSAVLYDPHNQRVHNVTTSKQKYSTIACFTPQLTGSYAIFEESNGKQISKNSYTLHCIDPNRCKILGNLSKFLQVGRTARFNVISQGAGPGDITVQFSDDQICQKIVQQSHYVHTVTLKPTLVGSISITIAFSGISIPKMPLKVEICDAYRCKVLGDLTGQHPAGKKISFSLVTAGAGHGKAVIKVQSPTNHEYAVNSIESGKDVLECTFIPEEIGDHSLSVMWGIEHVLGSPFDFTIVKSNVIVCIAGLEHLRWAIAKEPAKFSLQADESGLIDSGALSVTIKSVRSTYKAQVKSEDVGDGVYHITYIAPKSGSYTAEIKHQSQNIIGSPFKIDVFDFDVTDSEASKCRVMIPTGEGVHHTNTPVEVSIDTSQVDNRVPDIDVTVSDPNNQQIDIFPEKNESGYVMKFIPEIEGLYKIIAVISDRHIQGSPFELRCVTRNAKMVKVDGEGLKHGKLREWAEFTVDTKDAGQGVPTITAVSKRGPFDIECKAEYGRYRARYNPPTAGEILITIKWFDVEIPKSPFKVDISDQNGYEPFTQRPTTVIVTNPAFNPSNFGPDIEGDIPDDISSSTDSYVEDPYSDYDDGMCQ